MLVPDPAAVRILSCAPSSFGASPHVGKSKTFSAPRLIVRHAGPVISDLQSKVSWIGALMNADDRRLGVANRIAHSFLSNSQKILLKRMALSRYDPGKGLAPRPRERLQKRTQKVITSGQNPESRIQN